ncbi:MAG: fructose-specific PTS transporter subunit EIIC [Selenomonadales bacterium]|nr:fructose-specific PTS transporter subunit EIIC [Selenomonadales bacterium]MDY3740445.1 fructose-specific PTS transporter subunit EIIC [Selenomonadaceae bacterium]MEE1362377.1 fructose-specific PTS transporter subunit EIIC [Selenomonadaceae bacterium]
MRITDLLKSASLALNTKPTSKTNAIEMLADLMDKSGNLSDKNQYLKDVMIREKEGTTGLGDGIATPHAKSIGVRAAGLAAMTVPGGLEFESLDGKPARLFFMIAAPASANDTHLELLQQLSMMIMDPDFKEALIAAKTKEEFLKLIDEKENGTFVAANAAPAKEVDYSKRILAVTACPTGIAHTFMAAESLERAAQKKGVWIKVETNGSGGAKNVLTKYEIEQASCIIIAADKNVEMGRFDGKHMIKTKVADGINKPDELITRALSGKAPIYHHTGGPVEGEDMGDDESAGRKIYKHLMNGVSHMLPFVIGGGILIALAFLFDTFDPANPGNFGSNTPLAKFFKDVGGASFGFMLPVLAGFIAMSIADRPGLAVGFVGGAMAASGGSGFLGALLAGFAGGYIVIGLKKILSGLPASLEGVKPVLLYPVLGIFLMGALMQFIITPPVASINEWLLATLSGMDTSSRVMIGLIMGGMMAIDMGGPINKAAYVTGTGLLAGGEYGVMAAVMAGGMVPPIAIALCTTFFPNRFTENETKTSITNFIMGMSFITEGAIPFAAADPIRVIPGLACGAATAGALSMAFECTLRAPHGGIFVVPTIGNPVMYLVAIAIGAVVGCLIMSVLKKPIR